MKETVIRYYTEDGIARMEVTQYIKGGTEGILATDPRLRPLSGFEDLWFLVSAANLACDLPELPHHFEEGVGYNENGELALVQVKVYDVGAPGYYESSYWGPLAIPERPGVVFITEVQFLGME